MSTQQSAGGFASQSQNSPGSPPVKGTDASTKWAIMYQLLTFMCQILTGPKGTWKDLDWILSPPVSVSSSRQGVPS